MKWAPGDKDSETKRPYFFVSDNDRYTVTIPVAENENSLAYVRQIKDTPALLLGGFTTVKAAKAACEVHHADHP